MSTAVQSELTPADDEIAQPKIPRSTLWLTIAGSCLVGSAFVIRDLVAPALIRMPAEFHQSVHLTGAYTGVNLVALNSGRTDKLLAAMAPFSATQTVDSVRTSGNSVIADVSIVPVVDGWVQPATTHRYAIDRSTFSSAKEVDQDVVKSDGLLFTLPPRPEPKSGYLLWNQATNEAVSAEYVGVREVADRQGFVYRAEAEGVVVDPAQLGLPISIPKDQLIGLAPEFIKVMDAEQVQRLLPAFAELPDDIVLNYRAKGSIDITADSQVGAPLAMSLDQEISASIDVAGETLSAPFSHYVASSSKGSQKQAAAIVQKYGQAMSLVRSGIPLVLALLGSLALGIAAVRAVRQARESADPWDSDDPLQSFTGERVE